MVLTSGTPKFRGHFIPESGASLNSLQHAWGRQAAEHVFQVAHFVNSRLSKDLCVRYEHGFFEGRSGGESNKYDRVVISKRNGKQKPVALEINTFTFSEKFSLSDALWMLFEGRTHRHFARAVKKAAQAMDNDRIPYIPSRFKSFSKAKDKGIPGVPNT